MRTASLLKRSHSLVKKRDKKEGEFMKKKRIIAFLTAIILVLSLLGNIGHKEIQTKASALEDNVHINIHYHRFDGNYEGWNVWVWPKDKDGSAHQFNGEDDFGKVLSLTLDKAGLESVGFIIRLNEWEKKDFDADRYIDITQAVNNQVDVYILEGDGKVYQDASDIDLSPQFLSASFYKTNEIKLSVTAPIDTSDLAEVERFKVTDEDGTEYKIKRVWSKDLGVVNNLSLIMEDKVNFSKKYKVSRVDYGEKSISMAEVFALKEFEEIYAYTGELGNIYAKEATTFRVWAPTATEVALNLYKEGLGDNLIKSVPMAQDERGTWVQKEDGDLHGVYYTYSVTVNGITQEAVDIYTQAAGANGVRGMVVDLSRTNPEGWDKVERPTLKNPTDAIIYELHVRDLSSDPDSGIKQVGKYLGLTEKDTVSKEGLPTGLSHLLDLGVTHVHLLPSFDYASVDETKLDQGQFNWGYDPVNYNVPEGSYSTDPYHGEVRINEFKQMVKTLHDNNIGVIMDVVYNHTAATVDSNFNKIVPDYYYRKEGDSFSNGSGCGNETASERAMMRKYIVESVVYWATEYKVAGFRFDLMGLHDTDTMNAVREALDQIDPSIIIYGEGWTAGNTPLLEYQRSLKANASKLNNIAVFSDDIRDGIKGSVFEAEEGGFVSGKTGMEETIKFGVVGSTEHTGIDYTKINYSDKAWASAPTQTITYASAHDNLSLWDKLASSNPQDSVEDRIKMNKLSAAIVLTSQGIPFFQAGEEILRTKVLPDGTFDHNSYQSPDSVNSIKWATKSENKDVYEYYKGLIAFRKANPSLRMATTEEVQNSLTFVDNVEANVVAYEIKGTDGGRNIFIVHNANNKEISVTLPQGNWDIYVDGQKAGTEVLSTITDGKAKVNPISTLVLAQGEVTDQGTTDTPTNNDNGTENAKKSNNVLTGVLIAILGAIVVAGSIFFAKKNKKKK